MTRSCVMKSHMLLLVLLIALVPGKAKAIEYDYRGQVYIKKTGIDAGDFAEVETWLMFQGQKSFPVTKFKLLNENTLFGGKGILVLDEFFPVIEPLQLVRLIVREIDGGSSQTVVEEGFGPGQLKIPGMKVFTRTTFLGPGEENKWIVKLKITVSLKFAAPRA